MELTSRDNPLIKECAKLLSDAKARRKSGRFVIEGARLCEDAARSGVRVLTALATPEAKVRYATQWRAVEAVADSCVDISASLAKTLSDTGSPQGVFCLCERLTPAPFDIRANGVYLALEDVQDPGNLGTVIRTAEALGIDGILLSAGCCDVHNPKVLRASMGGVFRQPLFVCDDLVGELTRLSTRMSVLACVVGGDGVIPVTAAPKCGVVAVIGNEGNGMSAAAIDACTHRVTIPMAGRAESLNASMAAGILLWELVRERDAAGDSR